MDYRGYASENFSMGMSWRWLPTIGAILLLLLICDERSLPIESKPRIYLKKVKQVDPVALYPPELLDSLYRTLPARKKASRMRDSTKLAKRMLNFN